MFASHNGYIFFGRDYKSYSNDKFEFKIHHAIEEIADIHCIINFERYYNFLDIELAILYKYREKWNRFKFRPIITKILENIISFVEDGNQHFFSITDISPNQYHTSVINFKNFIYLEKN